MSTVWGKMRYGWSKYGGPMFGLVKSEHEWYCQSCSQLQPEGVAQYMIPINETLREYVRVCSICKHKQISEKINYRQLIIVVRPL